VTAAAHDRAVYHWAQAFGVRYLRLATCWLGIDRGIPSFQRVKAMAKHRTYSIEFQAASEAPGSRERISVGRPLLNLAYRLIEAGAYGQN
jgi:hypothetical protein